MSKVYAFIDSQNLSLGIKTQGWTLDFNKLRFYLQSKYNVSKAFLFIGNVPGNESLYSYLQNAGYIVILKPTLIHKNAGRIEVKGNVDAELVLYAVDKKDEYDKAIIVSGDGDFRCLLDYLEERNKLFKVFIPNKQHFSALLRKYHSKIVFVGELRRKVEYKKRKAVPQSG